MNNYANGAAYGQAASAAPAPMLPLPCKPANCKILHNLLDIQGHEILSSYGLKKTWWTQANLANSHTSPVIYLCLLFCRYTSVFFVNSHALHNIKSKMNILVFVKYYSLTYVKLYLPIVFSISNNCQIINVMLFKLRCLFVFN